MKRHYLVLTFLLFPLVSIAGGPQVYEQANLAIGTANVGQAALADELGIADDTLVFHSTDNGMKNS